MSRHEIETYSGADPDSFLRGLLGHVLPLTEDEFPDALRDTELEDLILRDSADSASGLRPEGLESRKPAE